MSRIPLSADRYFETWRVSSSRRRIDLAVAMAMLSGYETMLNLDTLTLFEIDVAIASHMSGPTASLPVDVFGKGVMHAWGRTSLAESLRVQAPIGATPGNVESVAYLTGQLRAVFEETWQDSFEWAVLSGDPRVRDLSPSIRADYVRRRELFAAEERRRSRMVSVEGLDPRKAGFAFALTLHMNAIIARCVLAGVDPLMLPFDSDPVGFVERIPDLTP